MVDDYDDLPHPSTVSRSLKDEYDHVRSKVTDALKSIESGALVFDQWTDNCKRFPYITFNHCGITDDYGLKKFQLCT